MARRDDALERLLDLDGFLAEVGAGFWIKIVAQRVPLDVNRPHGVGLFTDAARAWRPARVQD